MDNDRPVTRAELKAELKAENEALEVRIDNRFHQFEERMEHLVRETETHLLNAFYSYTQSNDKRIAGIEIGEGSLRQVVATLQERVTALERRLNMPPAQ